MNTGTPATASSLLPAADLRSLCEGDTEAFLSARLGGAIDANLDWRGSALECDGGPRPDGHGLRASFAGELPSPGNAAPRRLRFIFGIDLNDTAPGKAQALPTNLTVILEGEKTLYSTRGDERCASQITAREPAPAAGKNLERIAVRGYCLAPAEPISGGPGLLAATFEFIGIIRTGEDP
ncbi:MAG: hypothetical protein LBE59_01420 [Nevskiaceae bacterium]|nr:hypothetical protein [Nevskiaceae bacterium]